MNPLVESSLRATVVFALAFGLTKMLRRQSAAFRHVIWAGAFGVAAATPVLLEFGPRIKIERPTPLLTQQAAPVSSVPLEAALPASQPISKPKPTNLPFLEIIWIGGVILAVTRIWNAQRKAHALLRNARPLQNPSETGLPDFTALSIRIAETHDVATAMTLGLFRPWILLPLEHRAWEAELLRAVLLHEMAHVRRRDCLVQWLPNLVCAVHWFNPLAWMARSQMLCESERACDDAVLRCGISGSAFARDLVEIAQTIRSKGDSLMIPALTTKLERRIARLLDPAANRMALSAGRAFLGAFVALALLAPIAAVKAEPAIEAPLAASSPKVALAQKTTAEQGTTFDRGAAPKPPRVTAQVAQAQVTRPTSPAQAGTGSLTGVVVDPSGGVIVGATVRIRVSPGTTAAQAGGPADGYFAVTDSVGQWSLPNLPAGMYTIQVQVRGFKTFEGEVTVDQGVNQVNAALSLGRVTESVTVVAQRSNAPAGLSSPSVAQSSALRPGGEVEPARLIRSVKPAFPQSVRDRGVQGSVTFLAIIGSNGFLTSPQLTTVEAPPELVQAAMDAIKQWVYSPSRLNGVPVDVVTEITVNFQLQ